MQSFRDYLASINVPVILEAFQFFFAKCRLSRQFYGRQNVLAELIPLNTALYI